MSQEAGSADKGAYCQAWWPEFNPQDSLGEEN